MSVVYCNWLSWRRDIVENVLAGRQPVDLTAQKLKRLTKLPTEWAAQRQLLGFNTIT